jgi:hypothetical protein
MLASWVFEQTTRPHQVDKMDKNDKEGKFLRRNFLKQSGLMATGIGAGAVGLNATLAADENNTATAPEWPWPYKVLDVELVRKRGHMYYYKGGCMYGVTGGLLSVLIDEVGHPWTTLPHDMMRYGSGGIDPHLDIEIL